MTSNFKKPDSSELKKKLTPQQYVCTQENGTERPFENEYWNNHDDGVYVDVVSGEPLFASIHKFDSSSGWPSFDRPLNDSSVKQKTDTSHGMQRVEVRSVTADSHLGHVFDDGPETTGLRFCINSAALKFVSVDQLQSEGLGQFLFLFAQKKGWEVSTIAGGCFWGLEHLLKKIPGVIETQVGYTGGHLDHATYDKVKTGKTMHAESVQILFDPKKVSLEKILLEFFRMHDPTTSNRQGNDVGTQYRSAIFYNNEEQKKTAEKVIERVNASGKWKGPVVTEVKPYSEFWRAEEYHQDYLEKEAGGYTCHFVRDINF